MPIFKLLSKADWEESQALGYVKLGANDIQFIHMCEQEQIADIMPKIQSDQVMVVQLDPSKLLGRLVKEANKPGGTEFWHLYDTESAAKKIPLDAVLNTELRIQARPALVP